MKWDGSNSIMLRHQNEERAKERMANLEAQGRECEKCGEMAVEVKRWCKATNTNVTAYCADYGQKGCLFKYSGKCSGNRIIEVCQDCGKTQGEE